MIKKFKETGTIHDKICSGKPKKLTKPALRDVTNKLERSPTKSLRRLSQETGLSLGSTHHAVHKMKFHPYKVQFVHELKAHDTESHVNFCEWFTAFVVGKGENILDKTFFTNEAWFHLFRYVNSQNLKIWSTENLHMVHEKPLHDTEVGVWCAVPQSHIIGPIFF